VFKLIGWLLVIAAGGAVAADIEAGRKLYEQGVLASGEPLVGIGFGGTTLDGEYAACLRCHRKSGFGSYEGGYYIPPITQPYLFGGRQISRDDRFRALFMQAQSAEFRHQVRRVRDREPYDQDSLATVLHDGLDPNGRRLETLMPRYRLGQDDLANLKAYLETLSAEISPGVGEQYVELATIVHPDIPKPLRDAMLGTIESFVEWYNERTRGDLRLAGHSVYGSSLYTRYSRLYRLHVWTLQGPPEQWRRQLERLYREQPVFAIVSGQIPGSWGEVAAFADAHRIPAIFPINELPHAVNPEGGYSVYFNAGLRLEAELMFDWLRRSGARRVLQLHTEEPESTIPAADLRTAADRFATGVEVVSAEVDAAGTIADQGRFDALVVWQAEPDVDQLRRWWEASGAKTLLLPDSAIEMLRTVELDPALAGALRFSHARALEQEYYPERYRAQAWMNTRGLDFQARDVQFRAYYAMLMFRDSFIHLLDHYHRDFLLEVMEHQIQGSPNPGLYPDMELAPRQRMASKSGYIVKLDPDAPGGVTPVSDRIVP